MPCHTLTSPKTSAVRPSCHGSGRPVLLGAFGLRLVQLGAGSLWYDETVSAYLAGLDLPAMIAHTAGDIHPPLYYALLHFWTLPPAQRIRAALLSLFFGLLSSPSPNAITSGWRERAGWLAALLAAISPFNVWYSQEVRMYTLGSFLALLSTFPMVRMLEDCPSHSSSDGPETFGLVMSFR